MDARSTYWQAIEWQEERLNKPKPKSKDGRNIIDHFFYWTNEAIKAELDKKRHDFAILASNLYMDFNIAQVLRCHNAFLGKKFYIYGHKRFDRRGCVGTYKYEPIEYLPNKSALDSDELKKYNWIGVDNIDGAKPLESFQWPKNTLMLFGQEQVGLPPEFIKRCKDIVYIKQYGSVRSLNVGVAAAIAMFSWCLQHGG